MIRLLALAALMATPVQATETTDNPPLSGQSALSFCGARVTALAWFYKGVVEADGLTEHQGNLDSLLHLRTEMRAEAIRRGPEYVEQLDARSESEIEELTERLQESKDSAALALSELNIDIKSCLTLLFEKQE